MDANQPCDESNARCHERPHPQKRQHADNEDDEDTTIQLRRARDRDAGVCAAANTDDPTAGRGVVRDRAARGAEDRRAATEPAFPTENIKRSSEGLRVEIGTSLSQPMLGSVLQNSDQCAFEIPRTRTA